MLVVVLLLEQGVPPLTSHGTATCGGFVIALASFTDVLGDVSYLSYDVEGVNSC